MRIALFCPSWGQVGGIETKARILGEAFATRGHAVVVLARGDAPSTSRDGDVPLVRLPYHQLPRRGRHVARQLRFARKLPGTIRALRRALADARTDVVLTLAVSSYAPYMIGLAGAVPVVLSLEGGELGFTSHPHVLRRALRRATHVVAVATSLRRAAVELAPEIDSRATVILNGVDSERFETGPAFRHPRPYVLAVGRLSRQKGLDVLLDAFARLGNGDVDLLVAGEGPERRALEARRRELGLDRHVHFLGTVDGADTPALYRGAVLVACPSRWEGLPLVCLEAMASGRAVVASAVDGVPEAVLADETGVLVPPDDPAALASALSGLLHAPERRDRLGARGAAIVRERFAWSNAVDRYLTVLDGAAAR
jgi:glycosyltransferase involved in cell wall biosynthesis